MLLNENYYPINKDHLNYKLNFENFSGVFAVPCDVADKYICEASGVYIKVLLIIIHSYNEKLSPEQISEKIKLSVQDVNEAISYWISKGLLLAKNNEKASFTHNENSQANQSRTSQIQIISPKPNKIALGEVSELLNNDKDLSFLLSQAEVIMGKLLNSTEKRNLIYLYEETRMPADVILMAVDLSVKKGKPNIKYITKMCESWADLGILSHEAADKHIKQLQEKDSNYNKIKSIFGIGNRNLTTREKTYIDAWFGEFDMSVDMIKNAYEICADKTGNMSFAYINTIIKNWKNDVIKDAKDIAMAQKKKTSKRINTEASFDINELEQKGISIKKS